MKTDLFKGFKPNGGIPIVGAPCEAFEAVVIVTMRCKCLPENTPFVLTGVGQARACVHCRNVYAITQAMFDRTKGMTGVTASVSVVGHVDAPTDETPQVAS